MARGKPKAKLLQDGTLMLFGVIGDEFDGLDSKSVVEEVRSLGEPDVIHVLINSPGGFVSEGLAIYHELVTNPASIDVEISGVAASMASAIAMAGDTVRIAANGMIMIHDPWSSAVGNAEELRKAAQMLDKMGDSLAGIYQRKTGRSEAEIRALMAEETWLDAEEALELGFVDEIVEPLEAAAFADIDTRELTRVPDKLVALIRQGRRSAAVAESTTEEDGNMSKPKTDDTTTAPAVEVDASAGGEDEQTFEFDDTPKEAVARERKRVMAIRRVARTFDGKLPEGMADKYINEGRSDQEFRAAITDFFATQGMGYNPAPAPTGGVFIGADEHDKWIEGMTNWILVKAGAARMIEKHTGERPDAGEYRGYSMVDIAREALEIRGHRTRGQDPREIIKQALIGGARAENSGLMTRSDFPVLLENVLGKMLLAAYGTAPDSWREVAAVGSVRDFRESPRLRLGTLPRLDKLLEAGEFRNIHFPDAEKETIQAETHGNIIGLTRQALVNDDVDGFARIVTMLGRAAARSIDIDLFALLASNGGLGPTMGDGDTLFHANHNNIASTAAAPTVDSLEAARVLMAQQQDKDGNDYLDLRPDVWAGPIAFGAAVRVAIGAEFDFAAGGATPQFMKPNVVRDLLSTVADTPRLSGDRWYVFADPELAPTFEVVFLEGQESPTIEVEEGFRYDGIQWRVRHDYGVGAVDWRPAVTNAGS